MAEVATNAGEKTPANIPQNYRSAQAGALTELEIIGISSSFKAETRLGWKSGGLPTRVS